MKINTPIHAIIDRQGHVHVHVLQGYRLTDRTQEDPAARAARWDLEFPGEAPHRATQVIITEVL